MNTTKMKTNFLFAIDCSPFFASCCEIVKFFYAFLSWPAISSFFITIFALIQTISI